MINSKLRWVLALILLGAACAKAVHGLPSPIAPEASGSLGGQWTDLGLAAMEAGLAVWLFSGHHPIWAWRTTLGSFVLFAAVSLAKVVAGDASCGCFGDLDVSPWYSLMLDALVIASLIRWRPRASRPDAISVTRVGIGQFAAGLVIVQLTILAIALTRGADDSAVLADRVRMDQPLSVLGNIDIRPHLQSGRWLVLFYKNHCSACTDARTKFESLAVKLGRRDGLPRVASIEIPPYVSANDADVGAHAWYRGRLDSSRKWQLPAPLAVMIEGGIVRSVFREPGDTGLLESIWVGPEGGNE
jgi:hypothetical protein